MLRSSEVAFKMSLTSSSSSFSAASTTLSGGAYLSYRWHWSYWLSISLASVPATVCSAMIRQSHGNRKSERKPLSASGAEKPSDENECVSKDQTLEEDKNARSGPAEVAPPLKGLATLSEDLGFSS